MQSYIKFENGLINILNNQRLTQDNCNKFRGFLEGLKGFYGVSLSKQFFLIGVYNSDIRNKLNTRLNRIIKKAEIPTEKKYRYSERLTSKKGILFKEKSKEVLTFFAI